jgi:hypothetical protein
MKTLGSSGQTCVRFCRVNEINLAFGLCWGRLKIGASKYTFPIPQIIWHRIYNSFSVFAPCVVIRLHNINQLFYINPLNAELNPICCLLTLLGGATIVVVSRLKVNIPIYNLWCLLYVSKPRVYLQEDVYMYNYVILCFTNSSINCLVPKYLQECYNNLYHNCTYKPIP